MIYVKSALVDIVRIILRRIVPLIFLDENLANQGVKDIIQISQFVELAFSLRNICAKTFLNAYTPRHISEIGRPNPKR